MQRLGLDLQSYREIPVESGHGHWSLLLQVVNDVPSSDPGRREPRLAGEMRQGRNDGFVASSLLHIGKGALPNDPDAEPLSPIAFPSSSSAGEASSPGPSVAVTKDAVAEDLAVVRDAAADDHGESSRPVPWLSLSAVHDADREIEPALSNILQRISSCR